MSIGEYCNGKLHSPLNTRDFTVSIIRKHLMFLNKFAEMGRSLKNIYIYIYFSNLNFHVHIFFVVVVLCNNRIYILMMTMDKNYKEHAKDF